VNRLDLNHVKRDGSTGLQLPTLLTLNSAGQLALVAVAISFLTSNSIVISAAWQLSVPGDLAWPRLLSAACLLTLGLTGAVLSTFAVILGAESSQRRVDHRILASSAITLLAAIEIFSTTTVLPRAILLFSLLITQVLLVYSITRITLSHLNAHGPIVQVPAVAAAGVMLTGGVITFLAQTWVPTPTLASGSATLRELLLVLVPVGSLAAMGFMRSLRLEQASIGQSLRLRLNPRNGSRMPVQMFWVYTGGAAIAAILSTLATRQVATDGAALLVYAIHFGSLGIIFSSVQEIAMRLKGHQQAGIASRMTGPSARKFLQRHINEKPTWAATVGLRTSNFMVDHDPDGILQDHMPATLMQIRSEEIQRCISELLGNGYLHNHVVGHRVYGTIDPEGSRRPCVDILKMVSCLYLDAGPLIERRLKGLAQLLPMIDPGLARALRFEDLGHIIRRNQWFFHFDYGWVDQHVVHTPTATRYGVQTGAIAGEIRENMVEFLHSKSSLGSFVWVGSDARDRLLQEAPVLANTIEACPIPASDQSSETLVFIIKFEHLIPRLQRYYDLDSTRRVLLDFDPSHEATKLIGLFSVQLAQAERPREMAEVVNAITSYPWRGFKEKDNALRVVIEAYRRLQDEIARRRNVGEEPDAALIAAQQRTLQAVEQIGYPSQILHHAHVDKIALRDVQNLTEAAAKSRHARYHEAWLLIATTDPGRWRPEDRKHLLEFLSFAAGNRALSEDPFVQTKAIDALAVISRGMDRADMPLVQETVRTFAGWFATRRASVDICCQYLDTLRFMQETLQLPLELDDATRATLEHYFVSLRDQKTKQDNMLTALLSRWQEMKTGSAQRTDGAA